MASISVLAATTDPGSALTGFLQSIDAQTVPTAEFELVIVDASTDGSAVRLRQLAERRPNVVVVVADGDQTDRDRLGTALDRATGDYVLVVSQQQRLAPRALELLLDRARRVGADLVLGRLVTSTTSGCATLPDDVDRLDLSEIDSTDCLAAVRRTLLADSPDPCGALRDLPALVGETGTVSAVGRYACAIEDGIARGQDEDVSLEAPVVRWDEGMLHLTVRVHLPEPVSGLRAWLVATRASAEIALPAPYERDERDQGALIVSAVLDPATAEAGDPLTDGPWDLWLRLAWPGQEVTVALASAPTRPAVVAGRPHVAHAVGPVLQLDAGATRTSVIARVPRSQASVAESAEGTLLTLAYPDLHVHGDSVLDARLLLDRFALPARLVCHDGRGRLTAYASSLAGTSTIAVAAGGGKPLPTGLRLRVDGVGRMTVEDEPTPEAVPTPSAASAGRPAPLVQRIRRRTPLMLEPLVRGLSHVRVLRHAYRRLISR